MKVLSLFDGISCARNLPLEDGVHSGGGYDLIGCTKERYTPKTFTVATEEEKVEVTEHADGTIKANGIQIFSPHTNEEMRDFKEKLQEHLDLHFPKDGCKERGPALVLFAEAIYLANKQISDLKKSIREEIGGKKVKVNGVVIEQDMKNLGYNQALDEILSLKSLE